MYVVFICVFPPTSDLGPAVRRRPGHSGARYYVSIYIENEPPWVGYSRDNGFFNLLLPMINTLLSSPSLSSFVEPSPLPFLLSPALTSSLFQLSPPFLAFLHTLMLPYSCWYQCDIHELNFRTVTNTRNLRLLEKFSCCHPALMSYAWCSLSSLMLREVVVLSMRVL